MGSDRRKKTLIEKGNMNAFPKTITHVDDLEHLNWLLPQACIEECTTSGDNGPACKKWVETLGMNIPRAECMEIIDDTIGEKEFSYGCDGNTDSRTDESLNETVLWLAAWHDI